MKRFFSFKNLIFFVCFLVTVVVFFSVAKSGLNYLFDRDELSNSQKVYLIAKGYVPYKSFYSIYSPVFYLVLIPIYSLLNFTFESIIFTRFFMLALFILRIFLSFLLISRIFNRQIAYLFIPLFLFDPFTVFSGMQIRSDNLMLVIHTAGLLFFAVGLLKQSKISIVLSGFLLCTAFITNIKIFPSFLLILAFFTFYCLKKKLIQKFLHFSLGILLSLTVFSIAFYFLGYLSEMIQQVFIDSQHHVNFGGSYAPLGLFYNPYNQYLYGSSGKPLTWIYAWCLPILAFIGAYQTIFLSLKNLQLEKNLIKIILVFSLITQWFGFFFLKSVYVQYYLLTGWLFALFTAVFVNESLKNLSHLKILKNILAVSFYLLFLALSYTSIKNNLGRSNINFEISRRDITPVLAQIPKTEKVFPSFLFRPPAYPVVFGNSLERFPPSILQRLQPPLETIKKNKISYLFFSDPAELKSLAPEVKQYIEANFKKWNKDYRLWIRTP